MSRIPVQLSPGVNYSEIDISTIVPSVSTAIGGIAGVFQWGPVEKITTVTSEDQLVQVFGKPPRDENGIDFHCAANFLQYSRNLKVVRIAGSIDTNANSSGTTGIQYLNEDVLGGLTAGDLAIPFYARYPGLLGNSLKVVVIDGDGETTFTTAATAALGSNTIQFSTVVGGTLEENDKLIFTSASANFSQTFLVDSASGFTATIKSYVASVIPNASTVTFRSKYADLFSVEAETSTQASNRGGSNDELNVVVVDEDGDITGTEGTVLEVYQTGSKAYDAKDNDGVPNYIGSRINNNSSYVWVGNIESLWGSSGTKQDISTSFNNLTTGFTAAGVAKFSLSGATASTATTERLYIGGYSKFADRDNVDVSLLISGRADNVNVRLLTDLVNDRKDCVLFISPALTDILNKTQVQATTNIVNTRNNTYNINSSYVVMDTGWKYIYDKYNDIFRYIPLNADIAGLCARSEFNTQAWFSPAGLNRGQIKNVIKLAFNPDQSARDILYVAGVNPVVTFSGEGTVLYGDKTLLKKPSAFDRINVRRLFITLEKSIAAAAKYSLFEFNDEFTRSQFRNLVIPYLRTVQSQRGIIDYKVVCDESNNTAEIIDRNQFVADIFIRPNRSVNFIQLNFIATRTDSTFTEIV